jgi:CBS domain-containing protein
MMLENKISSLVVTNDSNEIVGIITKSDLINVLENSSIPVSRYASKKIINLKVGSSLLHARRLMLDNNVKRVLITFDSEVVGIITESDIANFLGMFRKVSEGVQWYNKLKTINVEDIMSRDVVVINENSTLGDAVKLMKKNDISGLPVVNNQNKLAGIITKTDLIRAIVDLY